jgi:hypothetical protein
MSTNRHITTGSWGTALVRSLAYTPWLAFMIPPVTMSAVRRERSGS